MFHNTLNQITKIEKKKMFYNIEIIVDENVLERINMLEQVLRRIKTL